MKLDERKRLDLHSGDYVRVLADVPVSRLTRLLPMLQLNPNDQLVDFACGNGLLAKLVHDRVTAYHGVDFSPQLISEARKLSESIGLKNVSFYCQDIVSFCADRSNKYDVVTAFDFSEHIYDDDFIAIFNGAYQILKPGGSLYLYTPNLDFFWERLKDIGLVKQFPQHIAVRTHQKHLELLQQCNFRLENIHSSYPAHFNIFRFIHPLRCMPLIGRWFEAKLFYRCIK